jgi:hypothetical protein
MLPWRNLQLDILPPLGAGKGPSVTMKTDSPGMPTSLKANTLLTAALAAVFYLFYMFAKHDPRLSAVAPFLNDPYDAIGSFAAISSVLLVLLALVRAFWPYRTLPTEAQCLFLSRIQLAIALAVLITLASDLVAMVRHPSLWLGTPAAGELVALLGGVAVGVIVVIYLVRRSLRDITLPVRQRWPVAVAVSLVALLTLAVYPESLIQTMIGHLFTIGLAVLLLFASLAVFDIALAPFVTEKPTVPARWRSFFAWLLVLLVAVGIGLLVFLTEIHEGGVRGVPLGRIATLFAVLVGVGTYGILLGYARLRQPLRLW